MSNPTLVKSMQAGGAIAVGRICCFGASDGVVVQATAATDALIGVCHSLSAETGGRVDVMLAGVAEVALGGSVTRGGPVTSDANGKGVAASPGNALNVRIIGFALESGVADEMISLLLQPGMIQGQGAPA
ncbi:MAG: DUF2190 family protein [Magnetococcales bacterium]|nr:DUF2190 family protein [Magnetococcales bacterium]